MTKERYACVWFDNEVKEGEDFEYIRTNLRHTIDFFRYFNDLTDCLNFFYNLNETKVFLITTKSLAKQILPIIHSSENLRSIWIFHSNVNKRYPWMEDYQKIRGSYDDLEVISSQINEVLNVEKPKLIGISYLSSNDKNRQDPTFMYFQLIKEIILNDDEHESEEQTKDELIDFCQQTHSDDPETLEILNEFKDNYLSELSIYWYTRECFLYRLLNKSLRVVEVDVLYKLRYFLRDLHQQIIHQSKLQTYDYPSMIVYRGQNISKEDLEKLKTNLQGYLSFNSFLSTSLNRNIAIQFTSGKQIGVLFEIFVDTNIQRYPFAQIEHISFQQGKLNEQEILFSMGTVFRLIEIEKEKHFYRIQLMLTNDVDQELHLYKERIRVETFSTHSFLSILNLFYELKQYQYLTQFIQIFKRDQFLNNNLELSGPVNNVLGLIYHDQGHLNKALKYLNRSLEICSIFYSENHPRLASTYNNLGIVYSSQSDYNKALKYYQLALDCQNNSPNPNISSIMTYTSNMAFMYNHLENYEKALQYHQQVLQFKKEYLGENDPSLTTTYTAISSIYHKINDHQRTTEYQEKAISLQENAYENDPESSVHCLLTTGRLRLNEEEYDRALESFHRALKIQEKYFLSNNPSFAVTYDCIAQTYYQQKSYQLALEYHFKGLNIEQNSLATDHPTIATSFCNISKDYLDLEEYSNALEYGFKAINQIENSSQADFQTLSAYHRHIAEIYLKSEQYEKSLKYFQKSLELIENFSSENDQSLAYVYYKIAFVHDQLENYQQALSFYQKTLNIELRTLPDDASTIAVTYQRISVVYIHLKQLDRAMDNAEKALHQLLKTLPHNHHDVNELREGLDYIKIIQITREEC